MKSPSEPFLWAIMLSTTAQELKDVDRIQSLLWISTAPVFFPAKICQNDSRMKKYLEVQYVSMKPNTIKECVNIQ